MTDNHEERCTNSLDLGYSRAACLMYSSPRTNVFHRLIDRLWSLMGAKEATGRLLASDESCTCCPDGTHRIV